MKNFTKIFLTSVCYTILTPASYAKALSVEQRFFYIGGEAGIVKPVQKSFRHKKTDTKITLKKSSMFSGKIGYSFYPQVAIEFSATYQPTYKLGYKLPEVSPISSLSGKTKVASEIYMVNLVYDLKSYNGFTPFVIGSAGIARLLVKPTSSSFMNTELFRIKKNTPNCFAWQVGIGIAKEITDNFTIDLSAKLQAVHNIKLYYEKLNPMTGKFVTASPIKKTIGVGEFGIGVTYKFPAFK